MFGETSSKSTHYLFDLVSVDLVVGILLTCSGNGETERIENCYLPVACGPD